MLRITASAFETFLTLSPSRSDTSSFSTFWNNVLRFLLPFARPDGLPERPALKREWTGGFLYPTPRSAECGSVGTRPVWSCSSIASSYADSSILMHYGKRGITNDCEEVRKRGHASLASRSSAAPSGPLALPSPLRVNARRITSAEAPYWRQIEAKMAASRATASMALPLRPGTLMKISPSSPVSKKPRPAVYRYPACWKSTSWCNLRCGSRLRCGDG